MGDDGVTLAVAVAAVVTADVAAAVVGTETAMLWRQWQRQRERCQCRIEAWI